MMEVHLNGASVLELLELGNQDKRPEQWFSQIPGIMPFSLSVLVNLVKDHCNTSL